VSDAVEMQEGRSQTTHAFQDPNFRGSWSGYERDSLFLNARGPRFYDAGQGFDVDFDDDGRAVAPVDIDGDGDLDLAFLSLQGLRMLENRSPARSFARVKLEAAKGDAQAIGAHVVLKAGGVTQRDFVKATSGFATQVPLDLHFGLGPATTIDEIEVRWRDGSVETHRNLPVGKRIVIRQGSAPRADAIPRWPDSSRPRASDKKKGPPGVSKEGESVFVYDPEGRLRRAWHRPVTQAEIDATLAHLGRGTFHADYTAIGTHHLARREFAQAEQALKRAVEMDSSFPIAHFYTGILHAMRENHDLAAGSFRRAIVLDPFYRQAMHNLGVALYKQRKYGEAAETLNETIKLEDGSETRHILGQVLAESGKLDPAITQMKRALELEPRRAEAHADLGKIYAHLGRKDEARSHLEKALELKPDLEDAKRTLEKLK
jgi:Flp pilus assembly protein TadD